MGETQLIIGASEADANLFYATGFLAPDPFVFVRIGEERILLMSDLEVDRARSQARVDTVLAIRRYEERAKAEGCERPGLIDALAVFLAERGIRRAEVPGGFPIEYADALRNRGVELSVRQEPFFPERLCKSPREIEAIRHAMRRTEAALAAAVQAIRESEVADGILRWRGAVLTSEAVRRLISVRLLEDGLLAQHTIVACGEDACDPHNIGSGPLRAGETIILDVFPRDESSRYYADITRTVVKGTAPETVRRMYRAVADGQAVAFGGIRDGADGAAIHQAVLDRLSREGFESGEIGGRMRGFFHGTGHGLGLEIHELPRISKAPATLRSGAVVTVEPGLYYPGIGGVRIEDVVVVTDAGCENLTEFPKELEV